MLLLLCAPGYASGIEPFSNRPGKIIDSPNDLKAEARKSAELAQWQQLQEAYISGKSTQGEYVAAKSVDLQDIGYMVYEANGDGGCDSGLRNTVY